MSDFIVENHIDLLQSANSRNIIPAHPTITQPSCNLHIKQQGSLVKKPFSILKHAHKNEVSQKEQNVAFPVSCPMTSSSLFVSFCEFYSKFVCISIPLTRPYQHSNPYFQAIFQTLFFCIKCEQTLPD